MWLALSQVQEWVLEFCADMLYISIRTDVAWYRLTQCAPALLLPWQNGGMCCCAALLEPHARTCGQVHPLMVCRCTKIPANSWLLVVRV